MRSKIFIREFSFDQPVHVQMFVPSDWGLFASQEAEEEKGLLGVVGQEEGCQGGRIEGVLAGDSASSRRQLEHGKGHCLLHHRFEKDEELELELILRLLVMNL